MQKNTTTVALLAIALSAIGAVANVSNKYLESQVKLGCSNADPFAGTLVCNEAGTAPSGTCNPTIGGAHDQNIYTSNLTRTVKLTDAGSDAGSSQADPLTTTCTYTIYSCIYNPDGGDMTPAEDDSTKGVWSAGKTKSDSKSYDSVKSCTPTPAHAG